jgi:N utilization substance protein B
VSTSRGPEARPFGPTGLRRQARERALHLLYESEVKAMPPAAVLAELPVAPDPYAASLTEGVGARLAEIDALLASHASGWAVGRMPAVDRQLLRLATYELLAEASVPAPVVIDEAIELAKEYSTEESGRYLNGVLVAIARDLGRLEPPDAPAEAPAGRAADSPAGRPSEAPPGASERPEPAPAGTRPGTVGSVRPAHRR